MFTKKGDAAVLAKLGDAPAASRVSHGVADGGELPWQPLERRSRGRHSRRRPFAVGHGRFERRRQLLGIDVARLAGPRVRPRRTRHPRGICFHWRFYCSPSRWPSDTSVARRLSGRA